MFELGSNREFVGVLRPENCRGKTHAICKINYPRRRGSLSSSYFYLRSPYLPVCSSNLSLGYFGIETRTDKTGHPMEVDCKHCIKVLKRYIPLDLNKPDWVV